MIKLDSLVRGAPGVHKDRIVQGRVFRRLQDGAVGIIGDDSKQWVIYKPELVAGPRSIILRGDIPARLRA